jgi:fucose permease
MASLLLAIIYLAFISLGLPDSLLGSAWPEMHQVMGVPLSAMGIVTTLISICTVVSSLLSDSLTRRFSTRGVVTASVGLTALGLFGFSLAPAFWVLCLFAIPYGLGAGAIDAALNNYVALHYTSRHMSWLHCFWGVGTILSPYVMSYALGTALGWAGGYRIIGGIQAFILIVLVATLPIWKRAGHSAPEKTLALEKTDPSLGDSAAEASTAPDSPKERRKSAGLIGSLKISGVPLVLLGFFGYCAAEATVMSWSGTYFYETYSLGEEQAASLGALFFIGMTVGRFASGFISNRLGDKNMIRLGESIIAVGVLAMVLPFGEKTAMAGIVLVGLGCAPIYPCVIHSTPEHFGPERSQSLIGIQMASAYIGTVLMPPLFGMIAEHIHIGLMGAYLLILLVIMFLSHKRMLRFCLQNGN